MDSGPHDSTIDTQESGSADTSVQPLRQVDARAQDTPVGMGLGRVLTMYGCGVLVLGVLFLVVSPVSAFAFMLELMSPSTGFMTTLTAIGAGIVGIGALIALVWAQAQKEAGADMGQGAARGGMVIALACLAIIVWALANPLGSGSHQSLRGQFGKAHRVVTRLSPIAITVDGHGSLYVLDHGVNERIVKVSPSGTILSSMPVDGSTEGFAVASGGDTYAVQYGVPSEIDRLPASGKRPLSWQASSDGSFEGINEGPLASDSALAVDRRGVIYLGATLTSGRDATIPLVREYMSSGSPLRLWQGRVRDATDVGMAIDGSGNVYLGDQAGNRLQSFTPSGKLRWTWTSSTHYSDVGMSDPPGVALDRAGHVYMAGGATFLVEKISATGHWLSAWPVPRGTTAFDLPNGLAVDRQGSVYVEINGARIFKYSSSGKPLAVWK